MTRPQPPGEPAFERIRVLLIEDDPDDRLLVEQFLEERARGRYEVTWCQTAEEGAEALEARHHDAVILDYRLGGGDGLGILRGMRERGDRRPVIMLTGWANPELDREVMEAGAADFLPKRDLSAEVLERALRYALQRAEAERALRERAEHQAAIARMGAWALDRKREERLPELVAEELTELLGVTGAGVYGWEGEAELLRLGCGVWKGEGELPPELHAEGRLSPLAAALPAAEPSLLGGRGGSEFDSAALEPLHVRALLMVPVPSPSGVRGALVLFNREGRGFRDEEVHFVQSAAHLLATVARRQAAEREATFRAELLDKVAQSVVATDHEGRIRYWNRASERIFGWSREEVIGEEILNVALAPRNRKDAVRSLGILLRGEPWSGELRARRKDGTTFPALLNATPLQDDQGELTGFVGISTDLSDQKVLEEQLRQAQKMDAVGRLAGGIAHDFNNILTVIRGRAQFLLDSFEGDDERREDAVEIEATAARAGSLTRQLLTFSRSQVSEHRLMHLHDGVRDVVPLLHSLVGDRVILETRLDDSLTPILIDPNQFDQVLLNLAVNARDAMPDGGRVRIDVFRPDEKTLRNLSQADLKTGEVVALRVTDTGIGIPAGARSRVFEPFFTTKSTAGGHGLGLPIVYGIVSQAGGEILVESEVGKGTSFTLVFPAGTARSAGAKGPEKPAGALEPRRPSIGGGEVVLLVDDDAAVRRLIHRTLTSRGYSIIEAGTAREAQTIAETKGAPVHLLLTDVVLPEMPGPHLADKLRRHWPEMQVLFTSGYTRPELTGRFDLPEDAPFLEKPFSPNELLLLVRSTLDSRSADPNPQRTTP